MKMKYRQLDTAHVKRQYGLGVAANAAKTLLLSVFLVSLLCGCESESGDDSDRIDGDLIIDATTEEYKDTTLDVAGNVIIKNGGKLILDNCKLNIIGSYDEEFAVLISDTSSLETKNSTVIRGKDYQIGVSVRNSASISFTDTVVTNHLGIGAWDSSMIVANDSNIEEIQVHDTAKVTLNGGEEIYPVFFFNDGQIGELRDLKTDEPVTRTIEVSEGWKLEFVGTVMNGYQIDVEDRGTEVTLVNCEGITASVHTPGDLDTAASLSNVTTGSTAKSGSYAGLGPEITYTDTVINLFNIYVGGNDSVIIDGGIVNEANTMESAELTIRNCQMEYNLLQAYDTSAITVENCSIEKEDDSYTPSVTASGDEGGNGSIITISNSDCSGLIAQAIESGKIYFVGVSNLNLDDLDVQDKGQIFKDGTKIRP